MTEIAAQSLSGSPSFGVKGMHPRFITAAVAVKGSTLTQLALDNGYNEAFLRNTLKKPNVNGEAIIAKFLGIDAHLIWPDRYKPDGRPDHAKFYRMQKRRDAANTSRRRAGR